MIEASIITCVWNKAQITEDYLEGIAKTKGVIFELIIIDNGSRDKTPTLLKKYQKQYSFLRVITNKKNRGFGPANNQGAEIAQGQYLLFLNNDVVVQNEGWLEKLVQIAKEYPRSLLGPMLVDWNDWTLFRNKQTPYINGWCVFGEKKMFEEIAEDGRIFDENFGLAYFEDVELSQRARLAGYELKETLGLGLIHLGSRTITQLNITKQTEKAQLHFYNKMTQLWLKGENKKRIVFYCAGVPYPFDDSSFEGKGVGGAEASLICLTREFAKKGWQVEVYNKTEIEGEFNGVEYYNLSHFRPSDYCDVFVLFRSPVRFLPCVNAILKIFWSCDQYTTGLWEREIYPFIDKIIAISPYHKKYLLKHHKIKSNRIQVIELGIKAEDYQALPEKVPGKLIYCSVPHRGLAHLARLFPKIKEQVPEATLYITSDYRLWGTEDPLNSEFPGLFGEGVYFLGKVPRKELVEHQLTAEVMAFPCTYEECFCIAAMECMAAGAIPVTTDIGALKTTVGKNGIVLSNLKGWEEYDKKFIQAVVRLLTDKKYREEFVIRGRERALGQYAWSEVVKNWENLFLDIEKLLGGKIMARKKQAKVGGAEEYTSPVASIETEVVLKFSREVEFNINGVHYAGKEIKVPYDVVPSALDIVKAAYGQDVIQ